MLSAADADLFLGWVEALLERVLGCSLEPKLEAEIVDRLADPFHDDQLLAKVDAFVEDEQLKKDLIHVLMVLDGTLKVSRVAETGRPLEWA